MDFKDRKILVLGKNGRLGRALLAQLGDTGTGLGHIECNFLDDNFTGKLESNISAIINTAAYTNVDKAESERDKAFRINAEAPDELAAWCEKHHTPLVHMSTDYVFDGSCNIPYREYDKTEPINVYGESKLAGEQAIKAQGCDYLIMRTSLLYDATSENFFTAIRRKLREQDLLDIIADQICAPTYTSHLAKALLSILAAAINQPRFPSGIYHLCNSGEASRYDFAQAIFEQEKIHSQNLKCHTLSPITMGIYPTPARRPLNCRLDCSLARETFGIVMREWEEGLRECFSRLSSRMK